MLRRIRAERDSVCYADDVNAPNAEVFFFMGNQPIADLMRAISGYVPSMKNVVWAVTCQEQTIGYLFSDETAQYQYELTGTAQSISELPAKTVFCAYYWNRSNVSEERFPECATLLERVKALRKEENPETEPLPSLQEKTSC